MQVKFEQDANVDTKMNFSSREIGLVGRNPYHSKERKLLVLNKIGRGGQI